MAATSSAFCHLRSSPVLCCASPKYDPARQRLPSYSPSNNWWTPLFGWSSEPDYIQGSNVIKSEPGPAEEEMGRIRSKFALGCFTDQKAKELRRKTIQTSTFHDIMYHSTIASRLASDVQES